MTPPSDPPAAPHPDEDALFDVFGALREHVVEVSAGFRDRVNRRLETVHRDDDRHRLGDVVTSLFVEAFNFLGGSAGLSDPSWPEDDDEHD